MAQYKIVSSFYHKNQFLTEGSVHELDDKAVKYLGHAVEKVEDKAPAAPVVKEDKPAAPVAETKKA